MTMQLNTTVEIKAVAKDKGLPVAVRMEHWGKAFYVPLDSVLVKQAMTQREIYPSGGFGYADEGVEEVTSSIDLEAIPRARR